jgi:predicted PurR-regulated permease PerM
VPDSTELPRRPTASASLPNDAGAAAPCSAHVATSFDPVAGVQPDLAAAPPAKEQDGESNRSSTWSTTWLRGEALAQFDARGACLVTLTVLAVLFALQAGRDFIVPLVLAIILAYALDPLVAFLERRGIHRFVGTLVVMGSLVALTVFGVLSLQNQVVDIVNMLPGITHKLSRTFTEYSSGGGSVVQKLRSAASAFQSAGNQGGARVVVDRNTNGFDSLLLSGSMSVATFVGQAVMVGFLVFFLLISGNTFKRKFVKVAGRNLSEKKISVHMLDTINTSIQRYLVMMVITNAALGLITWGALRWIGLENAGTWAVVAAALHMVPYFGPVITALCTGIAALMQFEEIGPAILTAGTTLIIATVIGVAVTTWMTGRIAKMNTVSVFVVLLLFTWIWGVWGTLLSIPIAVIAKVVADHVEGMQAVAEFLGE